MDERPRAPWQIAEGRQGLPQKFRIGDTVCIPLGPAFGVVTGARVDPSMPGRIFYTLQVASVAEDRLEAADG